MITKEILEEAEFAKNHLMNSSLDERCKKSLLRLLNLSTMATNGISTEEKIQKITETIYGLVLSQITFLDTVDKKIENANKKQCENCKAMAHATQVEDEERKKKIIDEYKKKMGIPLANINSSDNISNKSWTDIAKELAIKPWTYIIFGLIIISPYGVQIVKLILDSFMK